MLVKYLLMTFTTESGIREDLTAEEIGSAMDVIIAKNAFITKGGDLKGKYNAQIVSRNVDQFEVA